MLKKTFLSIIVGALFCVMLTGCSAEESSAEESIKPVEEEDTQVRLFSGAKNVGKDITSDDITDFYYTEENINYDAYYQRYRFYVEDGKHMYFHETRERKDDYGPCTEEDTTLTGTVALTDDQWKEFYELVTGGTVKAREESADAGDSGPWLYMYWKGDKSKYQEFSFESYGKEKSFVDFCLSLISDKAPEDFIKNENMVFDYYEATVATVGGDESTEYVLYEYDASRMILACYQKSEDSEEVMTYRIVEASVLDDCMALVKKYKMSKWDKGRGLNGKIYVVKFMDAGEMKRVSSDQMPDDGREAFNSIRNVLVSGWANAQKKD